MNRTIVVRRDYLHYIKKYQVRCACCDGVRVICFSQPHRQQLHDACRPPPTRAVLFAAVGLGGCA